MSKIQLDRFKESYEKLSLIEKKLNEYLGERQVNISTRKATSKVDTLLKYEIGNAEYELKALEKLAFTYERHH